MKITKAEVFMLGGRPEHGGASGVWRPVGCRIYTDEGIYGDGEAAVAYGNGAPGAYGMLCELSAKIIGKDPMNSDAVWEYLYRSTFWGQNGGPIFFAALSAIDIALWDIKGKFFKVPLYVLLGGRHWNRLRAYASQLQAGWPPIGAKDYFYHTKPEEFADSVRLALEDGYDAVKIDFFQTAIDGTFLDYDTQNGIIPLKLLDEIERKMEAARNAAGPFTDIIVENHALPDSNGAVQIARIAEKYHAFFFEEPCTPNPGALRHLSKQIHIPIAHGERIYTRWQYSQYFEDHTIQVIQPDIGTCGGLTEVRKICDMAHAYDITVQAHAAGTPLSTDIACHLETAIPNFCIHEHHIYNRLMLNEGLTKYNRHPKGGFITAPEEPGIGNEFLRDAIDHALAYQLIEG